MKTTSTNPKTTYKRYIIQDSKTWVDSKKICRTVTKYFTREVETHKSHWTQYITHAYLFPVREAAEIALQGELHGNGEIETVEVSFQIQ